MEIKDNVMYFDNDDEITTFILSTNPVVTPHEIDGKVYYGYDYDFTPQYTDAINNGIKFKVNDPESKVMKHKAVNYGIITKPIQNIFEE